MSEHSERGNVVQSQAVKPNQSRPIPSQTSQALKNLRAFAIAAVVSFHSVLAYLASQPAAPEPFNNPPYHWLATPILDHQRWLAFDIYAAFQYVALMPVMFFLSGCMAVDRPPWKLEFPLRPAVAHRFAICLRRLFVDADRLLSGLSRYRRRSELARLLAALDRAAVLAWRPVVVLMAIIALRHFGARVLSHCAALDRNARPFLRWRDAAPLFCRAAGRFHRCLPAAGLRVRRVPVD